MMRARLSLAAYIAMVALCVSGAARAADVPRPPDTGLFKTNTIGKTSANPGQTAPRKDGLKLLEEELGNSLQSFSPKGSMDGVLAPQYTPPPAPVAPARRSKAPAKKDWMFLEPEDMSADFFDKDPLKQSGKGKPDQLESRKSSLELFYDRLNRSQDRTAGATSGSSIEEDVLGGRKTSKSRSEGQVEDANLPNGIKSLADKLRKQLGVDGSDSFTTVAPHSSFSDFFGLGQNTLSTDDVLAHQHYMESYRQLLEGNSVATTASPLKTGQADGSARAVPGSNLDTLAGSSRSATPTITPGNLNSFLNAGTLQDKSDSVLNQWNPLYAPPRVEPPRPAPLAVPTMEVPRRKF